MGSVWPPGADAANDELRPLRYSSRTIRPDARHDHWRATTGAWVASTYDIRPLEPFACESESFQLGAVRLTFSSITGQEFRRTARRFLDHGRDDFAFALNFTGEARGDAGDRGFHQTPGTVLVTDAAKATSHRSTAGELASLVLDRKAAIAAIGPEIEGLHGAVLPASASLVLARHLTTLRGLLAAGVHASQAERHGRILTDLLALAVGAAIVVGPMPGRATALGVRARQEIEASLGSPRLSVTSLCARLGVSRPTLHRLFEADGGVEAYIREQRLQRARLLLANPSETAPITTIAEVLGFADGPHFSRSFRARFGLSPREFRAAPGVLSL